jgi:glycosyltransferase involved in cell wall biosynthesis
LPKRILIFYDHFYPAYKAGGPVQSLVNLIRQLYSNYEFYVVCKPYEMNDIKLLDGIAVNDWNNWEDKAKVMYRTFSTGSRKAYTELFKEIQPDVIFVNGLFSLYFNIFPLKYGIAYCARQPKAKLVLSARGMLHPGALSQKAVKKKLFLTLFKFMGWHHQVKWHATDSLEKQFIDDYLGQNSKIEVAGNFPNLLPMAALPEKKAGELIMGTIALISPMKNHLEILNALKHVKEKVTWLIYGPVKDETYWQQCKEIMQQLPSNIHIVYKGELPPAAINTAMNSFQLFIMPSKSENFGHAIFEALSAGKPVVTTNTTPFKNLQQFSAGYTVSVNNMEQQLAAQISFFAKQDDTSFHVYIKNASAFAQSFLSLQETKAQYNQLFS